MVFAILANPFIAAVPAGAVAGSATPDAQTYAASNVTSKSAVLNGAITYKSVSPILDYGFYISQEPNILLSHYSILSSKGGYVTSLDANGNFSAKYYPLNDSTKYYFEAYAKSSLGDKDSDMEGRGNIGTGDAMSFTTLSASGQLATTYTPIITVQPGQATAGDSISISWSGGQPLSPGYPDSFDLWLYKSQSGEPANDQVVNVIKYEINPAQGQYQYSLPASLAAGQYDIKIKGNYQGESWTSGYITVAAAVTQPSTTTGNTGSSTSSGTGSSTSTGSSSSTSTGSSSSTSSGTSTSSSSNSPGGDGSSWGAAIHINSASDLVGINNTKQAGLYYVLENDIDLSSYTTWMPISDTGQNGAFFGHFDGNGHTISNLTINDTSSGAVGIGLFGRLGHGYTEIKNLTLTRCNIKTTNKSSTVGALTSSMEGSVTNCHAFGSVSGPGTVGGLIGSTDDGNLITNCSFSGTVSGTNEIGGLIGHNDGKMTGCFTHGSVIGKGAGNGVGGLVGSNEGSTRNGIFNCYSDASVSGTDGAPWVGGLVGRTYGLISNSYFVGSVSASGSNQGWGTGGLTADLTGSITNCYVGGPVYNTGNNFTGALVGRNNGKITGSFWDQDVVGQTDAIGHVNGSDSSVDAHGVSMSGMLTQSTSGDWAINQGTSFPYLTGVSNKEPQGTINIVLKLGIPTITVNGITTLLDAAPEINAGHAYLPIRPVVTSLGGSLSFDQASQQLTITCNGTTIVLGIGQTSAQVNGQAQTLDAAPYISNGRTMLPLRFVAQNLNCRVDWQGATQQATVSYPQSNYQGN